jgi:hypothetical protein
MIFAAALKLITNSTATTTTTITDTSMTCHVLKYGAGEGSPTTSPSATTWFDVMNLRAALLPKHAACSRPINFNPLTLHKKRNCYQEPVCGHFSACQSLNPSCTAPTKGDTPPRPSKRTVKRLLVPGGVGCVTRSQPPQPWQLTVDPVGGGG